MPIPTSKLGSSESPSKTSHGWRRVPRGAYSLSMEMDPVELKPVINRLKRAQGQLGAVIRMIEEGKDCAEIITQLSAASKAVDRAGFSIIATGLQSCMRAEANGEESGQLDREKLEKLFLSLA